MTMEIQSAIVVVVVGACIVHAVATLAPAALRRRAAALMLRVPLFARSRGLVRAAAAEQGGCHCAGCDHDAGNAASPKVVTLHRRPR
jgi:hypothetical protein